MAKPKIVCTSVDTSRYKKLTEPYPHLLDKYKVPLCASIRKPVGNQETNYAQLWEDNCPACRIINHLNKQINIKHSGMLRNKVKEIKLLNDVSVYPIYNPTSNRMFIMVASGAFDDDPTKKFKNHHCENTIEVYWDDDVQYVSPAIKKKNNKVDSESIDQINRLIKKLSKMKKKSFKAIYDHVCDMSEFEKFVRVFNYLNNHQDTDIQHLSEVLKKELKLHLDESWLLLFNNGEGCDGSLYMQNDIGSIDFDIVESEADERIAYILLEYIHFSDRFEKLIDKIADSNFLSEHEEELWDWRHEIMNLSRLYIYHVLGNEYGHSDKSLYNVMHPKKKKEKGKEVDKRKQI